eukprot:COSAG02_NODE_678_length_18586_cov_39.649375_10_plen_930_part_00
MRPLQLLATLLQLVSLSTPDVATALVAGAAPTARPSVGIPRGWSVNVTSNSMQLDFQKKHAAMRAKSDDDPSTTNNLVHAANPFTVFAPSNGDTTSRPLRRDFNVFQNPNIVRAPFVSTARSPQWPAALPRVRYSGPRLLTRIIDFTMNGNHGINASRYYANVTNATIPQLIDALLKMRVDAVEYDVINDSCEFDGGNGHTAWFSSAGPIYPQLLRRNLDWFGELTSELRGHGMEIFAYMPLAYNHNYVKSHPGTGWLYRNNSNKVRDRWYPNTLVCLNADGYLDLVANYSVELIENYPVSAVRYDGLTQTIDHHCNGCQSFYRSLYGEELPAKWEPKDWRRQYDFQRASTTRAVQKLRQAAVAANPNIITWANGLIDCDGETICPTWDLNSMDMLHDWYTTGFEEGGGRDWKTMLFHVILMSGLAGGGPERVNVRTVVGQWMRPRYDDHRLVFSIIGGSLYEYSPLDPVSATVNISPDYQQLINQTYGAIEDLDPVLQGARLVTSVAFVFSDTTRKRYFHYARGGYLEILSRVWGRLFDDSIVAEVVSNLDLHDTQRLSKYQLLVVVESSGFSESQLRELRAFASNGGTLVVSGDALLFDAEGEKQILSASMTAAVGLNYTSYQCTERPADVNYTAYSSWLPLQTFNATETVNPFCWWKVNTASSSTEKMVSAEVALRGPGTNSTVKHDKSFCKTSPIRDSFVFSTNTSLERCAAACSRLKCPCYDWAPSGARGSWHAGQSQCRVVGDNVNVTLGPSASGKAAWMVSRAAGPLNGSTLEIPMVYSSAYGKGHIVDVLWRDDSDTAPTGQANSSTVLQGALHAILRRRCLIPVVVVAQPWGHGADVVLTAQDLVDNSTRYILHFLGNTSVTVDLCSVDRTARIVSQYPREGWAADTIAVGDTACPCGFGALRVTVASGADIKHRMAILH